VLVFAVGLATPAGEIARAVMWPRSPQVVCSYLGVVPGGATTYVAPLRALPEVIRPRAGLVDRHDPATCWQGRWPDAATGRDAVTHPPAKI
jgi:hypothetical protein